MANPVPIVCEQRFGEIDGVCWTMAKFCITNDLFGSRITLVFDSSDNMARTPTGGDEAELRD